MPTHFSNPKCDVCGVRHSDGDTEECLQAVLAQSSEREAELRDALRACERSITELVEAEQPTSTDWVNLRAARHWARLAIAGMPKAPPPRPEQE